MLAEFLEKLVDLAGQTDRARTINIPGVHRKVWLDTNDGSPKEIALDPPLRGDVVVGLADIAEVVHTAKAPAVYVYEHNVTVLLDKEDRREFVRCPLERSQRFKMLETMSGVGNDLNLSPRAAIKLLRFDLPGAHAQPLIDALRIVDFTRKSDGRRVNEHGRESLGKTVEAAVQGTKEIPEAFDVEIAPFDVPGARSITSTVRVGVYIDTDEEKIVLRCIADELRKALHGAMEEIRKRILDLTNDVCPVLLGAPGERGDSSCGTRTG